MYVTKDQGTFHEKTLFHFQALNNCLGRILCFDFRNQLLGWGTILRELEVLSQNGYWGGGPLSGSLRCCQKIDFFCEWEPCVWTFLSGPPWAGSVQRGGFLFKEFWTRIVFWPATCLMCRGPSLMCRSQSLMCRDPSVMCGGQSLMCRNPSLMFR